ncbi:MAG: type IV conjugative transfer system protein TraL [Zoogloea oleivorans]|jgi:type IV conjugative transfer system protein TraL|uniref:type IV conjugative transfer system protein TraL n=1 Tax=Zoogloea oleivorans TaxID=1552750 RepID=UPI002A361FA1|nr:type IV conjugative transfer system protein TraL [Zoogloea oleivorans]MDY0038556.1 type IV conjugative transfer system protein TraL [Zoogloea oleivorans]
MSEESHIIPKHLDDPPMYLMWDADEAYAFLGPVFLVVAFSPSLMNFLLGGILGFFSMRTLARIKSAGGKQLIRHALYWYTPTDAWFKFRRTPSSDVREFVG